MSISVTTIDQTMNRFSGERKVGLGFMSAYLKICFLQFKGHEIL